MVAQDSAQVTVTLEEIHGSDQAGGVCCGELGKKPQGRPQPSTPLSQENSIDVFHS